MLDGAEVELGPLPLRFGPEGVGKGLRLNGNLGGMLLEAVDIALVFNQRHGQLVPLDEIGSRIGGLRLHGGAESIEGIL